MELFDLSPKTNKDKDKELVKQAGKKNSSIVSVKGVKNINQKVATMRDMVERYLGGEKDNYISVTELNVSILDDFVEAVEKSRIVALDTETTGLDTINDDIVGISLFTPGMKALYIPINHISYITNEKTKHQLSVEFLKKWFSWLLAIEDVRYIYFNAKFDYRVILNHIGVKLPISYDAYIASRLLNENEPEKGLKALYKKYVLNGEDDAFSFSQLFEDIPFNLVPIDTAYLYAAKDAQITYELYQFQLPYLTLGTEECTEQELDGVQDVFWNIEMPLIPIVAEMEQLGVKFDFNKQKELSERYHKLQDEAEAAFYEELKKYTPNEYLISSPTQLGTLFYDDLKLLTVQSRGKNAGKKTVDEKTLNQIDHPLVKIVLDYRGYAKLISTYIDKMAECAKYDGRVHGSFNQCGTDTGRMSSDSPKQNWAA